MSTARARTRIATAPEHWYCGSPPPRMPKCSVRDGPAGTLYVKRPCASVVTGVRMTRVGAPARATRLRTRTWVPAPDPARVPRTFMRAPLEIVRPLVVTFSAGEAVAAHDVGAFDVVIVNGPNAAALVRVASRSRTRTECSPSASPAVSSETVPLAVSLQGTVAKNGTPQPRDCEAAGWPSTSMTAS